MPVSALPFPNIDPVLISIGPLAIRWYALAYIVGILLGWAYARMLIRNETLWGGRAPLTVTDYDDFIVWITLGIILGGRLGYVLFYNPAYFAEHPLEIIQVWGGGMSFHGGFAGCVAAVLLFARNRGIPILSLGDLTCAAGPIGLFLGRIANFINGELWGRPTDVPWAFVFPGAGPIPRHPSQLYEALFEGVVLFIVLAITVRMGALKRPGLTIGLFAMVYAMGRSFCEFFREPDPQLGFLWGGLTMGMLLSIPLFLAGVAFVWHAMRRPALGEPGRMSEPSPLEKEIRRLIAVGGPMPIARYMSLCLTHPQHGYYITRDPFGAGGDFTTAPEVSQIFGELLGLWTLSVWRMLGEPDSINLVELGPGRGTMMRDALRAAKVLPKFRQALAVHMVEISPTLEQLQRNSLSDAEVPVSWYRHLLDVPEGPCIILANEYLDALPVHQVVKQSDGWHERVIGLNANGDFALGLAPDPLLQFDRFMPKKIKDAAVGAVFEWRNDIHALDIGRRVRKDGAALFIDYGHVESDLGETLQSVNDHAFSDPLSAPGLADITAHVNFQIFGQASESMGAVAHGPVTQERFLRELGIEARSDALRRGASAEQAANITAAVTRLTEGGRTGMGELFKVMAISDPKLGPLPGFGTA